LVTREPGPDGRTKALRLTPAGEDLAEAVRRSRLDVLRQATAALTAAERDQLDALVSKLLTGVRRDRASALRVCRLCDQDLCKAMEPCPVDVSVD
jgi:hypothetical protein